MSRDQLKAQQCPTRSHQGTHRSGCRMHGNAIPAMKLQVVLLFSKLLSLSGNKVSGICPSIVGNRVSQMVVEVLNRTLSGDDGLDEESEHRKHGQSSILELLNLQFRKCLGIISQPKWVKGPPGVKFIESFTEWPSTDAVTFDQAHEDDLGSPDGKDALGVHEVGVAEIVQAAFRKDLGSSLEPNCLAELDTILRKELGEDTAQCTEHGPPAVDHLELTVLGKGLWVS
ncbi:hypothetical protein RJ640_013600 [Escallonia rubra]|uniref:Uncharacterized protein n=1 Tax=Escallonia rubra TaxID=112253 RepID=A0AA88RT49_9ASTE|nr:hypothetical protein RJ640_013600 [Escallonia rubra]